MRRLARRYIELLAFVCGRFFTRKQGLVGVVGGEMGALEKGSTLSTLEQFLENLQ